MVHYSLLLGGLELRLESIELCGPLRADLLFIGSIPIPGLPKYILMHQEIMLIMCSKEDSLEVHCVGAGLKEGFIERYAIIKQNSGQEKTIVSIGLLVVYDELGMDVRPYAENDVVNFDLLETRSIIHTHGETDKCCTMFE